jgi:hypothetical protein
MEWTFDVEYNDEGHPIADSAPIDIPSIPPLRCSPRHSLQQHPHANNDNKVRHQEECERRGCDNGTRHGRSTHCPEEVREYHQSSKDKKLVKQTQGAHVHCICNAITKLTEHGQGSSSNMGAIMNMILIHQMERIDKNMDNWDSWEVKERNKECKHWQN